MAVRQRNRQGMGRERDSCVAKQHSKLLPQRQIQLMCVCVYVLHTHACACTCASQSFLEKRSQWDVTMILYIEHIYTYMGFPGGSSGKEPACRCKRHKRHGFDLWVGKIAWRRTWQSTPVFLSGESYGQKNVVGYGP